MSYGRSCDRIYNLVAYEAPFVVYFTLALIETVPIGDIKVRATVNAPSERDRLKLLDIVGTEDGGWYFHSLLWERRFGDEWRKHHELTQDDFQWQHPNRRWVADVHSFSPDDGSAVVQVGEGSKPMYPLYPGRGTTFHYSWRRWDLINNTELKRLKDCHDPFDRYEPGNDES